ncbi:MAG: DUF5522 domain-containing protein [Chitinophagales bacterium]
MPNKQNQEKDYYFNEDGLLVFTKTYHLKRGYCCKNGCLHCPYGFKDSQSKSEKSNNKNA